MPPNFSGGLEIKDTSPSKIGCQVFGNTYREQSIYQPKTQEQMFIPAALWTSAVLGLHGLRPCHLSNIMPAAPLQGREPCLCHHQAPGPQAGHRSTFLAKSWAVLLSFMSPSFGSLASGGQSGGEGEEHDPKLCFLENGWGSYHNSFWLGSGTFLKLVTWVPGIPFLGEKGSTVIFPGNLGTLRSCRAAHP